MLAVIEWAGLAVVPMMDNNQSKSDRTWPLPRHSHVMRMRWHDLLFMHWPVEPALIEENLPGIECDMFRGQAWIAVVPFRMSDVAPRFVPAIPGMSAFPELNVRTYVTVDGKPGVWFFSLDATNKLAVRVARQFFYLPYMDATMRMSATSDGWFSYSSHRTHAGESAADLEMSYRPTGEPFRAQPGSLEYWLTARYCLYTQDRKGNILRGEIDHEPWPLQRAEAKVQTNTMLNELDSSGKVTAQEPHLLFSSYVGVRAWLNRRID